VEYLFFRLKVKVDLGFGNIQKICVFRCDKRGVLKLTAKVIIDCGIALLFDLVESVFVV